MSKEELTIDRPADRGVLDGRKLVLFLELVFLVMLTLSILFPLAFIILILPLSAVGVWLSRDVGRGNVLIVIVAGITVCSVTFGDFVYLTLFSCLTATLLAGVFCQKIKSAVIGAGICLLVSVAGAVLPTGVLCAWQKTNAGGLIEGYVRQEMNEDSFGREPLFTLKNVFRTHSEYVFSRYEKKNYDKPGKGEDGYESEVLRVYLDEAYHYGKTGLLYDVMNLAAFSGTFSYLFAAAMLKKKRLMPRREPVFPVRPEFTDFKELRLNRKFILFVFLPVFLFSFLGYVRALTDPVAAVVNAFSTVPCFFAGSTLIFHTTARIKKRALRIALYSLITVLLVPAAVFSVPRIIISVFGVADAALDVRRLIDYAVGKTRRPEIRRQ